MRAARTHTGTHCVRAHMRAAHRQTFINRTRTHGHRCTQRQRYARAHKIQARPRTQNKIRTYAHTDVHASTHTGGYYSCIYIYLSLGLSVRLSVSISIPTSMYYLYHYVYITRYLYYIHNYLSMSESISRTNLEGGVGRDPRLGVFEPGLKLRVLEHLGLASTK